MCSRPRARQKDIAHILRKITLAQRHIVPLKDLFYPLYGAIQNHRTALKEDRAIAIGGIHIDQIAVLRTLVH